MRQEEKREEVFGGPVEFTLAGGCVVCGGVLAVRMLPGSIRGYCGRCSWISKPLIWQTGNAVSIAHPPLGLA